MDGDVCIIFGERIELDVVNLWKYKGVIMIELFGGNHCMPILLL
jgi:hypothetical protein